MGLYVFIDVADFRGVWHCVFVSDYVMCANSKALVKETAFGCVTYSNNLRIYIQRECLRFAYINNLYAYCCFCKAEFECLDEEMCLCLLAYMIIRVK